MAPVRVDRPFSQASQASQASHQEEGWVVGKVGARTEAVNCSIEIEMSGLVEIEMSSFGVCSYQVDRTTLSGGGDAKLEPAGDR